MKNIAKLLMALLVVAFGMTACGDNAKEDAAVAAKIEKGETLSQDDYKVMVDYCVDYAKKAQEYQNKLDAFAADSQQNAEYTEKLAELTERDNYATLFFTALSKATPEEVGEENVKTVNRYAAYDYFVAPAWAQLDSTTNVTGYIDEMPSMKSTDSTGVITQSETEVVK